MAARHRLPPADASHAPASPPLPCDGVKRAYGGLLQGVCECAGGAKVDVPQQPVVERRLSCDE
eukprot:gene33809-25362_t